MFKQAFLDLETTGTDPAKHGVWQIAGRLYVNDEEVERFDYKMQPVSGKLVSQEALIATGMDVQTLKSFDAPRPVYQEIKNIFKRYVDPYNRFDKMYFLGYNGNFDYQFSRRWFEDFGDRFFGSFFWYPPIDIVTLAGQALMRSRPGMANFKLATVAKELDIEVIEESTHDADYDIFLARQVYEKSLKMIRQQTHVEAA